MEYDYTDVNIPYTLEIIHDNGLAEHHQGTYSGVTVSKVHLSVSHHSLSECSLAMKSSKEL